MISEFGCSISDLFIAEVGMSIAEYVCLTKSEIENPTSDIRNPFKKEALLMGRSAI